MKNFNLTQHFTISEMEDSALARKLNIDNTITTELVPRMYNLCSKVLEPTRAHFGAPIIITSGYRCSKLNTAVGGKPNSQHTQGEAVDFVCHTVSPMYGIYEWMKDHIPYDQLIYESCADTQKVWIHVSYREGGNRHQAFCERVKTSKNYYEHKKSLN